METTTQKPTDQQLAQPVVVSSDWFASVARLKEATGIACANCSTCSHLGSDGDGPEYNGSWPVCNKVERFAYLRSFPFKKEMKCWSPEFWHSKFVKNLKKGTDGELMRASKKFRAAVDLANTEDADPVRRSV